MNFLDRIVFHNCSKSYQKKIVCYIENWDSLEVLTLFTSGSTGVPKPVNVKKSQILESIKITRDFFNLKPSDVFLLALNIDFIAGQMMLYRALELKSKLIVIEPRSQIEIPNDIIIDFAALVPMQLDYVLKSSISKQIKQIIVGGASITKDLQEQIRKSPIKVYQTFGMTETVSHFAIRDLTLNIDLEANPYIVLGDVNINFDSRNCLIINGSITNNIEIKTNDWVEMVDQNSFLWKGRYDRVINSGGIKISLDYLESIVNQLLIENYIHLESFCFSQNDNQLGEKILLMINDNSKVNLIEKLISQSDLGYYKPRGVYSVDNFIYTQTGKIDRLATIKFKNKLI